jgi:hypothetical protein
VPFFAVREWTVDSSVVVVVGRWVVGGRGGHLTLSNSIKMAGLVENLSFVNVDVLQVVHRGVAVGAAVCFVWAQTLGGVVLVVYSQVKTMSSGWGSRGKQS